MSVVRRRAMMMPASLKTVGYCLGMVMGIRGLAGMGWEGKSRGKKNRGVKVGRPRAASVSLGIEANGASFFCPAKKPPPDRQKSFDPQGRRRPVPKA
jgi:hypothetical protein